MLKIISIVMVNENNQILLLKRSSNRKSFPNKWNFLSGKIEDETPKECAFRELSEELGSKINVNLVKEGEMFHDIQDCGKWEVHPFLFKYNSGDLIIDDEHSEYQWISKDNLTNYDIVPGILEDLKNLGI